MATSSSAAKPYHPLNPYGPTAAPPPTPSSQPNLSTSDAAAAETLSRLLHRLPPNLSLPTRRLSPRATTTTTLPTVSLSFPLPTLSNSFELGYFQLAHHHSIRHQLAESAESEALSLLELPPDQSNSHFPKDWPLGFHEDDDDNETPSFCLDDRCSTTAELSLSSLRELTRELERIGLEVVDSLACAVGFKNPFNNNDGVGPSSLMWISEGDKPGRLYPYVVGMQYQIRAQKWSLLSDSGSVVVEPQVGSLLVTLGDIAQVWTNGKLKKVRGIPAAILEENNKKLESSCISMTLLLTLPLESTISPLLTINPSKIKGKDDCKKDVCDPRSVEEDTSYDDDDDDDGEDRRALFNTFSFEDYAWRVYHERLLFRDPLDRYRTRPSTN